MRIVCVYICLVDTYMFFKDPFYMYYREREREPETDRHRQSHTPVLAPPVVGAWGDAARAGEHF